MQRSGKRVKVKVVAVPATAPGEAVYGVAEEGAALGAEVEAEVGAEGVGAGVAHFNNVRNTYPV